MIHWNNHNTKTIPRPKIIFRQFNSGKSHAGVAGFNPRAFFLNQYRIIYFILYQTAAQIETCYSKKITTQNNV